MKTFLKIVLIFCIPTLLFKGCLYMNHKKIETGENVCGLCTLETELIAENGEKLPLSNGVLEKRTGNGGWMECSCAMLISYQNNSSDAKGRIEKMGNYWKKVADCSNVGMYSNTSFPKWVESHAKKLSFPLTGECYAHDEYTDGQDINVIYNPKTNNLFYYYRAD